MAPYCASPTRYDTMRYNRCGRSGLQVPAISLGLWHNFGSVDRWETARAMVLLDLLTAAYTPPPAGQAARLQDLTS